jgi:DNA-binding response OmpR family regulator
MTNLGTVLIIDDDRDYASATAAILEASGYQVLQAYSGKEGFEAAKTHLPGLILLDVMMEERTTGYTILKTVPVIIISSLYHEGPNFAMDPDAGYIPADLFLAKPIDPPKLLAETKRLIGKPSAAAAKKG